MEILAEYGYVIMVDDLNQKHQKHSVFLRKSTLPPSLTAS